MQRGGLENEEGVTSGAGGEGVVALGTAGHVGTVCLDHGVGHVAVELLLGCAVGVIHHIPAKTVLGIVLEGIYLQVYFYTFVRENQEPLQYIYIL